MSWGANKRSRILMLAGALLLQGARASAAPSATLSFVSTCGDQPISVSPLNFAKRHRVRLKAHWVGLQPETDVSYEIRVRPRSSSSTVVETTVLKSTDRPDQQGALEITSRKISFGRIEKRINQGSDSEFWDATLIWTQRSLGGIASTRLLVLQGERHSIVEARGGALCHWQSPPRIDSPYRANDSETDTLKVSRKLESASLAALAGGVSTGESPPDPEGVPELPLQTDPRGAWFFRGWESLLSRGETESREQSWLLGPHDSGYIAERITYARREAVEWIPTGPERCAQWIRGRSGFLDSGAVTYDFYAVPRDLADDLARSEAFIERLRPALNTCGPALPGPAQLLDADPERLLFFTPADSNSGEPL